MKETCDLCDIYEVPQAEPSWWNDDVFVGVHCRTHGDPMAVLKRHDINITTRESEHILAMMAELWPGYRPRNQGMTSIKDHWHEHWIKEGDSE